MLMQTASPPQDPHPPRCRVAALRQVVQRRKHEFEPTGRVLGPIVTHLTWSLGMLFALPWALDLWS